MVQQTHIIRRQVIELHVRDASDAHRLSDQVSALVRDSIIPLLERYFSEVGVFGQIEQFDRLELDLGRISPAGLQQDFAAKVERHLPAALTKARVAARFAASPTAGGANGGPEAAALLLISQFARTGSLPWWSDARQLRALDAAIETARRTAPDTLAALLRGLGNEPGALQRLVHHQSDAGLQRLLVLLAPSVSPDLARMLVPLLAESPCLAGFTPMQLRDLLWKDALASAAKGLAAGDGGPLVPLLTRLAASAGTTLTTLLADIAEVEARVGGAAGPTAALARGLATGEGGGSRTGAAPSDLSALFDTIALRLPELAGLTDNLRPLIARLPRSDHSACATALDRLARTGAAGQDDALWNEVAALLRLFTRAGLTTMAAVRPALDGIRTRTPRPLPAPSRRTLKLGSDFDTLYVENAGLTLLWPFLRRYFARLGLLNADEYDFASEQARCRAVGLLHHVASGEPDGPEFWLALNKVLCGLEIEAVEQFGPEVTGEEAAETEQLLGVAIAHAGCLGEISISGFRGSFLLRRGALSTRDGAWLLRVERQPPDILLERFPWRTEWIRLPWMQAPLRVQW